MKKAIAVFLISGLLAIAPANSAEDAIYLSYDQTVSLAIAANLDIRIARLESRIKATDITLAKSTFDTNIDIDVNYKDDQRAVASTLGGTKALTNNYDLSINKQLLTGTNLDIDLTNQRSWSDSQFATTNPAFDSEVKFTITQALLKNFGGIQDWGDVDIAKLEVLNVSLATQEKIENIIGDVQKSYWDLVFAYRSRDIKKGLLDEAWELFKIYRDKLDRGLAEEGDFYATRSNLRQRQNNLATAEEELQIAIDKLKLLLNDSSDIKYIPTDALSLKSGTLKEDTNIKLAILSRRDYQQKMREIESKGIAVKMKENSRWPTLDLVASYARNGLGNGSSEALRAITQEDNPELYVGVEFNLLLENRQAGSEYEKAALEKEKLLIELELLQRRIELEVKEALRKVALNYNIAQSSEDILKLETSKLKEEEEKISYGRSSSDTLIRYQDDLLNARLNLARALATYLKSLTELDLTQDRLLKKVGIE